MIVYDKNWVRVLDGVLEPQFCEHLIERFNTCEKQQTRREDYPRLRELNLFNTGYRKFTA